jgi:hypothetical protein
MVAWARYGTGSWEINGVQVNNNASAIGSEVPITSGIADNERDPAVGYFPGADRFFVAWSAYNEAGAFTRGRGQLFNASTGATVGSVVKFAETTFVYVPELA